MLPLIESLDEVNCTAIKVCMVNGKQFEKEVKKNQVFFAIVPRGPSFGNNDQMISEACNDRLLEEIAKLQNEYKEIVAEEIPNGLPPVRSISHCMDLISGASFLNNAPYRLTPIENE